MPAEAADEEHVTLEDAAAGAEIQPWAEKAAADEAIVVRSAMQEAQMLKAEFESWPEDAAPGKGYLQRLAQDALVAAEKGYGIKRRTRTLRRTRVKTTTNTTDLRTNHTERRVEETCKVEEWITDGPAPATGMSVLCLRSHRRFATGGGGAPEELSSRVMGKAFVLLDGASGPSCEVSMAAPSI